MTCSFVITIRRDSFVVTNCLLYEHMCYILCASMKCLWCHGFVCFAKVYCNYEIDSLWCDSWCTQQALLHGGNTTMENLKWFVKVVQEVFESIYLQRPIQVDLECQVHINMERRFPRMFVLIRKGLNVATITDVPTSSIVKEVAIDLVTTFN